MDNEEFRMRTWSMKVLTKGAKEILYTQKLLTKRVHVLIMHYGEFTRNQSGCHQKINHSTLNAKSDRKKRC